MLSCGTFVHEGDGLWALSWPYGTYHGKPEFWSEALEETKDFVKDALKRVPIRVLESDCFIKEKHVPLLLNLFRLAYKTAVGFDPSITESEGYEYVFLGDNIDILKLCGMESNEKARKVTLRNSILLCDEGY